jgi:hypothetical protein
MVKKEVIRAVTCVIQTRPGLSTDELILACLPYTWNHVLLAVEELVRNGDVRFQPGGGYYTLLPATDTTAGMRGRRTRQRPKTRAHIQV